MCPGLLMFSIDPKDPYENESPSGDDYDDMTDFED